MQTPVVIYDDEHGGFDEAPVFFENMVPVVGVIMGSDSDWEVMQAATQVLEKFGVRFEAKVVSAHRTPLAMVEYAKLARDRGFKVLIAGAGGAAHLPGMVASLTSLPVIGVPVKSKSMSGLDSLYSIVQMPAGIPVATMAIDGAANAGLLAVRILSLSEPSLAKDLESYASEMEQKVAAMNERLQKTP